MLRTRSPLEWYAMGIFEMVVKPLPCMMVCPSMSKAPGEEGIAAMA